VEGVRPKGARRDTERGKSLGVANRIQQRLHDASRRTVSKHVAGQMGGTRQTMLKMDG
jgi:hypothetical protein